VSKVTETKWMDGAEKAIETARVMNNPFAKKQMLAIAEAYMKLDRYARQAEFAKKSESQVN
jgi:hypothetical protein